MAQRLRDAVETFASDTTAAAAYVGDVEGWLTPWMATPHGDDGMIVQSVYAQQATIVGTVEDESGLVLHGVTVTAVDPSTGLTLVAVSDGSGLYRVQSVPPGTYNLTAELPGFASVVLTDIELLVGQNATLDFTMGLATVQETITVTGEAPLIDFQQADVGGNVDRRQMDMIFTTPRCRTSGSRTSGSKCSSTRSWRSIRI